MAISTRFLLLLSFLCCLSQTACAVTKTVTCGNEPMYQNGNHSVATEKVKKGGLGPQCCSLLVAIPKDEGQYPVVQFQHGFLLNNSDYTGLISQIASWGFIVVAPQMYEFRLCEFWREFLPWTRTDSTTEKANARSILNWMKTGLIASLPKAYRNHTPDFDKVALAGHSRGGQVVFGLARKYGNTLPQYYSAIVGLDPVDGTKWISPPPILKHENNSMDVGVPTLIVGTPPLACNPEYQSHIHFYEDLKPESFHFVATNNGHLDFIGDCKLWDKVRNFLHKFFPKFCFLDCKSGPSRQCMSQFSAGIVVAFLRHVFFHDNASICAAFNEPGKAPVHLDQPQWKGRNISCTSEAHLEYADI